MGLAAESTEQKVPNSRRVEQQEKRQQGKGGGTLTSTIVCIDTRVSLINPVDSAVESISCFLIANLRSRRWACTNCRNDSQMAKAIASSVNVGGVGWLGTWRRITARGDGNCDQVGAGSVTKGGVEGSGLRMVSSDVVLTGGRSVVSMDHEGRPL